MTIPTTNNLFTHFCEGVALMLKRWTALQVVMEQDLAGPQSNLKQAELYEEIVSYFSDEADKVTADELEQSLFWYFDDTFNVELEDGSSQDVAERLCALYKQVCQDGIITEVERLKTLVGQQANMNIASQCRMDEQQHEESKLNDDNNSIEDDDEEILDYPNPSIEPIVDEDGFTLVQKGRGKRH